MQAHRIFNLITHHIVSALLILLAGCAVHKQSVTTRLQISADQLFTQRQYQPAFDAYQKLAQQGDKFAQYRLALMFDNGWGTEPSLLQAYAWVSVAAEFQTFFLLRYWQELEQRISAEDQPRADALALDLYRQYSATALARDLRRVESVNMTLGEYAWQKFYARNYKPAFRIYSRLAKAGDKYSQYLLATMYEQGLGTRPDLAKAYAWAILAAETGSPLLSRYLDHLSLLIDDQDKLAARNYLQEELNDSSLLTLAQQRLRKLKRIRLRCKRSASICGDFIQELCQDNPECMQKTFVDFDGDQVIHAKPGVNIYAQYEKLQLVLNRFIDDYLGRSGEVILGEFKVLEDEADTTAEQQQPKPQEYDDN
jgi:hypothetical protein